MLAWKQRGYEQQFGGCIVTYADDLVIYCTRQADLALEKMRQIHATAEADGERAENSPVSCTGRSLRFSGIYVWALLLASNGPSLYGHSTFEEEHQTPDREDP